LRRCFIRSPGGSGGAIAWVTGIASHRPVFMERQRVCVPGSHEGDTGDEFLWASTTIPPIGSLLAAE
jgi:hypothetical protein